MTYLGLSGPPETVWQRVARVYNVNVPPLTPWNRQPQTVRARVRAVLMGPPGKGAMSLTDAERLMGPRPPQVTEIDWIMAASRNNAGVAELILSDEMDRAIAESAAVATVAVQSRQADLIEAQNAVAYRVLSPGQRDKYAELQATAPQMQRLRGSGSMTGDVQGIGGRLDRANRERTLLVFAARYRPPTSDRRENEPPPPRDTIARGVVSGGELLTDVAARRDEVKRRIFSGTAVRRVRRK